VCLQRRLILLLSFFEVTFKGDDYGVLSIHLTLVSLLENGEILAYLFRFLCRDQGCVMGRMC
jgi:hypothetical protein